MANAFSKEERVMFEEILEGFNDALVLSRLVDTYNAEATLMERTNNTFWLPRPYVAQSFSGTDMTSNFKDYTQLSVPATIGFTRAVPWTLTATELRDELQEQRLAKAARQKLASDINTAVTNVAALGGSLVVKRTTAAAGYDDVAAADSIMTEQGVPMSDRFIALSTRDSHNVASNLAGRSNMVGKPTDAYERSLIGNIAGFDVHTLDTCPRLAAAAGVTVTINGANQYYTPKATSTASTGEVSNVDPRYQTITIAVTSGTVKVGDSFTIAGVNSIQQITKADTGQLKTFRIVSITTGSGGSGTVVITPPIISAGGGTDAETIYKNVTATPADGAAITFLNTVAAYQNPFWHKSAIKLLPGRYAVPTDAGAAVLRGTTEQGRGLEVTMQKQYDIATMKTYFRIDCPYGVAALNTEMMGVMLFSQT